MSELTKKLHILKDGATEEELVTLYSTTDECAEPNLKFEVDGAMAYAKLGDVTDSEASSLRVYRDSDATTYAVLKSAVPTAKVTITQSANQTIHVWTPQKDGGTDHTETFSAPIGTTYEAEVVAMDGYLAGTLTVTPDGGGLTGELTEDISFTVTAAKQMMTLVAETWEEDGETYVGYDADTGHGSLTPNSFVVTHVVNPYTHVTITQTLSVKSLTKAASGTSTVIEFNEAVSSMISTIDLTIDGTTYSFRMVVGSDNKKYSNTYVLTEGTHIITE